MPALSLGVKIIQPGWEYNVCVDVNLVVITAKSDNIIGGEGTWGLATVTQIISHLVHHVGYSIAGIGDIENLWN